MITFTCPNCRAPGLTVALRHHGRLLCRPCVEYARLVQGARELEQLEKKLRQTS